MDGGWKEIGAKVELTPSFPLEEVDVLHGENDAGKSCDAMIHQKPHTLTFFNSFFLVQR